MSETNVIDFKRPAPARAPTVQPVTPDDTPAPVTQAEALRVARIRISMMRGMLRRIDMRLPNLPQDSLTFDMTVGGLDKAFNEVKWAYGVICPNSSDPECA